MASHFSTLFPSSYNPRDHVQKLRDGNRSFSNIDFFVLVSSCSLVIC